MPKIILILQNYLFCGYLKYKQIKQWSGLELKFVIKILMTEKEKPCGIYRIMCMEKHVLTKKNVSEWVKHGFDITI